jgi:hypothetical protein
VPFYFVFVEKGVLKDHPAVPGREDPCSFVTSKHWLGFRHR